MIDDLRQLSKWSSQDCTWESFFRVTEADRTDREADRTLKIALGMDMLTPKFVLTIVLGYTPQKCQIDQSR